MLGANIVGICLKPTDASIEDDELGDDEALLL